MTLSENPVMTATVARTGSAVAFPDEGINYERLYTYRFQEIDQLGREAVWGEIAKYVHRRMGEPQRVLDPAAGRGEFITAVPAAERWGVDLVRQCDVEAAGVRMIIDDIMDADLPEAYFDGVFLSNFLEHMPSQEAVGRVLARLRAAMSPGGRIAVMGPNFRYCAREYFDCADHTVILTNVSMAEHLHAAGFQVTLEAARFLPFSFRGVLPPSPRLTRMYLHTPALWRLLGKQFLLVARR
jgi:SAM-dependent methyltransferase